MGASLYPSTERRAFYRIESQNLKAGKTVTESAHRQTKELAKNIGEDKREPCMQLLRTRSSAELGINVIALLPD